MSSISSHGTIHTLPKDMQKALFATKPSIVNVWEDITPLARNEWICWVESAKKPETRVRRISIMQESLAKGKRRPCCWAGCPHRKESK